MQGWKIAGIAVAALFALLAGALLLAWLLFDPNDYKDRLQSAFHDATGRDLRLDGPLSLSIFPWLAVETGAASVSNREGFGDEPFASLEHARLGVRLWPLLTRRRVELGPVRVDGLALRLAVARDGRNNWSDLLDRLSREPSKPASPGPTEPSPAELSVASVSLSEASLQLVDAQAGSRYAIEHWSLATGQLRRGTPFELDTALDAVRNERALGRLELHTRVDLSRPDSVALEATRGTAHWPRDGQPPLDVDLSSPRITLSKATRDIAVDALVASIGRARLETTLAIRQGPKGPRVTGKLAVPETPARALLESLGMDVPRTQDPDTLRRFAAHSRVSYSAARGLEFDGVDLTLDDTRLRGRVALQDLDRMALRFDLRGDSIDLDRYLPPKAAPAPEAGRPGARANRDARARKLDARGSLALGRVVVARIPLQDVDADLSLAGGQFAFAPLKARAFGGSIVTRLQYDLPGPTPSLRVEQQLRDVDVAAMLGQLIDVHALEGRGNANFSLHTRGSDAGQMVANLSGPFDLTVTDGALVGADMWFEIERAIAAAQLRKDALTSRGSGRTEFDRLTARGTIGNRTLHNDRMEFFTDFAQVHGRGDVDYGAGTLDLDLVAKLLKTPPGRLLGVKVSRVQDADIPLQVTGTLAEPKVRPDVSSLLEAIAKDALKQPFEGKVREQLEKIFKF